MESKQVGTERMIRKQPGVKSSIANQRVPTASQKIHTIFKLLILWGKNEV